MRECLVFTALAFKHVEKHLGKKVEMNVKPQEDVTFETFAEEETLRDDVQDTMWKYMGITRSVEGLEYALKILQEAENRVNKMIVQGINVEMIELRNMVTVAELIARAALIRKESRGTHNLKEYHERDDKNWLKHIIFSGAELRLENHVNARSPV